MKKNLLQFLLLTIFSATSSAQSHLYRCLMGNEIEQQQVIPDNTDNRSTNIICDTADNFRKFIRVNVHWVLTDAGNRNFRANDDGNGGNINTGYLKAEEMIDGANADILNNQQMWLPSGNSTLELPVGIGYILNGVYFDKSSAATTALNSDWTVHSQYGKDVTNTLNIYMIEADTTIDRDPNTSGIQTYNGGGIANGFSFTSPPGPAVKIYGAWNSYKLFNNGWNHFQIRLLQHEIGHTLSLFHTWNTNDGCNDTPLNNNCWAHIPGSSNCEWGQVSDNIMDYNQYPPAYSPCQIGKLTTEINSTRGVNYTYNCSDCTPANANFTIGSQFCGSGAIPMDCRGSYQENNYFLEIYKTTSLTSTNVISGTYFSAWYSGQAPLFSNLRTIYTPGFGNGAYRIKLAVQNFKPDNQACNAWDEEVRYITVATTSACPPPPPGKAEMGTSIKTVNDLEIGLSIYPNPSSGLITIVVNGVDENPYKIRVEDVNGREIYSELLQIENNQFQVHVAQAGLYLVRILTPKTSLSKKFVVTN